jgi:flagellar biosynthesis GTPase FlhF
MGELNFDEIEASGPIETGNPEFLAKAGTVLDLDVIRPKFGAYKAEAERLAMDAEELVVADQMSLNRAVAIGGSAKKAAKAIETQRKALILEPSEFVKGVNGIANAIKDSLDEAERITKAKIGQYQARVEMERRERERKAREEAEALQRKLDAEVAEANRKAAEEARKRAEEEQRIKREKEEAEARERGAKKAELDRLAKKAEEERLEAIRKAEEEAKKNEVVAPTVVAPVVQDAPRVTRTESGSSSQRKVWTFEITDKKAVPAEYRIIDEQLIKDAIRLGARSIPGVRIFEETKVVFRT